MLTSYGIAPVRKDRDAITHKVQAATWCTFCGASLRKGTSLQKRSVNYGTFCERFHSFTCTSTRLSTNGMHHASAFPAEGGSITNPEGMYHVRLSWPRHHATVSKQFAQDHCMTDTIVLICLNRGTRHLLHGLRATNMSHRVTQRRHPFQYGYYQQNPQATTTILHYLVRDCSTSTVQRHFVRCLWQSWRLHHKTVRQWKHSIRKHVSS